MPAKKKGRGNKLARMSDEERARYLQHRAELELEAKRRKQQLIAIFTKNKLRREEAFSRLNTAKINEQWRFILRQIKCKELYQDVESLWQNFDRMMKAKDAVIECLYNDLKTADRNHRRLQEAHIHLIDQIIGRHKQKFMHLHEICMRELHAIKSGEMVQLKQLKQVLEQRNKQVQDIIYVQNKTVENKLMDTKTRNAVNIHSIMYLKEDAISHINHKTFTEMENLWKKLNETINEYNKITENKRKQYEYLKEQDNAYQENIARYSKFHVQLQHNIEILKCDFESLSQKREETITALREHVIRMKEIIWKSRHDFTIAQTVDSLQLKKLSITSSNVIKDLNKILEKGSMLLLLIQMNSSLEPLSLAVKKYFVRDMEPVEEHVTNCICEPFKKLDKFWEQYNYIRADNLSMKQEYDKLSLENKQLRHTLRMYLISISHTSASRSFTSDSV